MAPKTTVGVTLYHSHVSGLYSLSLFANLHTDVTHMISSGCEHSLPLTI